MHIPDGYLSPSTCLVLYGASTPFWWLSVRRVRPALVRKLPRLALFASFTFVVMLFNLPLPGGVTGHPVGVGIATIILGPWESLLSISLALTIQALFFGDGGVTTLGANCFNMAIAGSFATWAVYRLLSRGATANVRRSAFVAAVAGYIGLNFSALLAGLEFGIQPLLFHDAHGVPLYSPYPLSIAVPAMLLGHLTVAGLAEALLTGGLYVYLRKFDIAWFETSNDTAHDFAGVRWHGWVLLGATLVLTPLGILAGGTAWGEWTPAELLSQHGARLASLSSIPAGLDRLQRIWTAPIAGYSLRIGWGGNSVSYLAAGFVGVAAILTLFFALALLLRIARTGGRR
jgi:cobalt/nickel transport system permease protein